MASREPPASASLIRLSRTRAVSPVRGDHGERTVTCPSKTCAFSNRTHEPKPGTVSAGFGFDAGQRIR